MKQRKIGVIRERASSQCEKQRATELPLTTQEKVRLADWQKECEYHVTSAQLSPDWLK
jgi:hypothetical protein